MRIVASVDELAMALIGLLHAHESCKHHGATSYWNVYWRRNHSVFSAEGPSQNEEIWGVDQNEISAPT